MDLIANSDLSSTCDDVLFEYWLANKLQNSNNPPFQKFHLKASEFLNYKIRNDNFRT